MRSFSNTKGTATGLALTLALSLAAMPSTAVADVRFIVFGDAPYLSKPPEGRHKRDPFKGKYAQNTLLEDKIAPAIQSAAHPFLIHLGDMKDGAESCTNALIRERYNQLMALHPGRVFYTPGDNDWTDCDRQWLDEPYSEIRRLEFLRTLIASNSMTLPADWHYAIQPEFPENARWTHGGVMFATVHIVGTNNGREEFGEDDPETARRLVDARDRANRYWLEAAFDAANRFGAGAVVIAIHADVTKLESEGRKPCSDSERMNCDGFAVFRDQLLRLAADFKKPVLLVHGDTTPFCLDKKFGGDTAPNLWRVNAFGDNFAYPPVVDATVITVNLDDPDKPFEIRRLMTGDSHDGPCK